MNEIATTFRSWVEVLPISALATDENYFFGAKALTIVMASTPT